ALPIHPNSSKIKARKVHPMALIRSARAVESCGPPAAVRGVEYMGKRVDMCRSQTQIPPDLVVKYQAIDIVEVIFSLIWRWDIAQTSCRNRQSRCEPLSPSEAHRSTTKSGGMWTGPDPHRTLRCGRDASPGVRPDGSGCAA